MSKIKIAIADDHKMFRQGLSMLLSDVENFEVIFDVENGRQLINQLDFQRPDVILMDLEMPEMNGMEATRFIRDKYPEIKIIAISMHSEDEFVMKMVRLGAKGYILKNSDADEVENAVFSVMRNNFFITDVVSSAMLMDLTRQNQLDPRFKSDVKLSNRELDVARLVCQEKTIAEIAEALHISPRTVEGYRKTMMDKIGARNMAGVIVYVVKKRLVD